MTDDETLAEVVGTRPVLHGPNVPWRIIDALQGLALAVVLSVLTFLLLSLLREAVGAEASQPIVTLALAALQVLLFATVWFFGIRRYRVPWHVIGFARPRDRWSLFLPWLALFLSLLFGSVYAVLIDSLGFDSFSPTTLPSDALGEGPYRLINVGIIGLAGPLAEEVFFRGFLLAALVKGLGTMRGVALGSAIFALSHPIPNVMVPVFVSGLLLSWLYLRTRSIWPPFIAHAAQNLIAISVLM